MTAASDEGEPSTAVAGSSGVLGSGEALRLPAASHGLRDATIPERMRHLPRDPRGYPIPVVILRDDNGCPHFTINEEAVVDALTTADGCHICGAKLGVHHWFVGGPASGLHPNGAYLDGPVHRECGEYALRVCPYLSRTWSKRLDGRTLKPGSLKQARVFVNQTMFPEQPAVFVFADARRYARRGAHFHPLRPWHEVTFWRAGKRITGLGARRLIAADPNLPVPFDDLDGGWFG